MRGQADIEVSPRTRLQVTVSASRQERALRIPLWQTTLSSARPTASDARPARSAGNGHCPAGRLLPVAARQSRSRRPRQRIDPAMLRDIDASQVAFSAGRYREALRTDRASHRSAALTGDLLRSSRADSTRARRRTARKPLRGKGYSARRPRRTTPARCCAQAYERHPDAARTLDAYERCVEVEPDNPDALVFLGRAYNAAERGADARRVLEHALTIAPHYSDVHLVLGIRDFADGRVAEARSRFERFLELSPERRDEVAVWLERTGPDGHERQRADLLRRRVVLGAHRPLRGAGVPGVRSGAVPRAAAVRPAGPFRRLAPAARPARSRGLDSATLEDAERTRTTRVAAAASIWILSTAGLALRAPLTDLKTTSSALLVVGAGVVCLLAIAAAEVRSLSG